MAQKEHNQQKVKRKVNLDCYYDINSGIKIEPKIENSIHVIKKYFG